MRIMLQGQYTPIGNREAPFLGPACAQSTLDQKDLLLLLNKPLKRVAYVCSPPTL